MYEFIKKIRRFEVKWPENCTAEFDGEEGVAEWYDTTVVSDLEELAARSNYTITATEKGVMIDGHLAPRDLNGRQACIIKYADGSRQWVSYAVDVDDLAKGEGAEPKPVFHERELQDPGEVRADWWSRDDAEARW